jgi:hypothetical protein
MNREEVTRLAEQAKILVVGDAVLRLCQLVAAAEREACAKVAEWPWGGYANDIAAAIRARGNT